MTEADSTYATLLRHILENGEDQSDRTGVGTRGVFGYQMRFDTGGDKFPLLTTKRVFWKGVVEELLWFLRGETNIASLQAAGVHIWDEWADENGDLGPVYGSQWRAWPTGQFKPLPIYGSGHDPVVQVCEEETLDQIAALIHDIRSTPNSRRLLVTAWNPAELPGMRLPPCHCLWQCKVSASGKLHLQLYQRSCDVFLGVPFNIASYALLLRMIAQVTGLQPGELIWTGGDVHIYQNHMEQVREQLSREGATNGPAVGLNTAVKEIDDFTAGDIFLVNYDPAPAIKAKVAV